MKSSTKEKTGPSFRKLTFEIPWKPFANMETRSTKAGFCYTPKEKKKFMKDISEYLEEYKGYFEGVPCLKITIMCVCERPSASPKYVPSSIWRRQVSFYKASRPDSDNYLKPLQDSLSHHIISKIRIGKSERFKIIRGSGIVDDDSCFVDTRIIKVHRKIGQDPHYKITIKELPPIYEPTSVNSNPSDSILNNKTSSKVLLRNEDPDVSQPTLFFDLPT